VRIWRRSLIPQRGSHRTAAPRLDHTLDPLEHRIAPGAISQNIGPKVPTSSSLSATGRASSEVLNHASVRASIPFRSSRHRHGEESKNAAICTSGSSFSGSPPGGVSVDARTGASWEGSRPGASSFLPRLVCDPQMRAS